MQKPLLAGFKGAASPLRSAKCPRFLPLSHCTGSVRGLLDNSGNASEKSAQPFTRTKKYHEKKERSNVEITRWICSEHMGGASLSRRWRAPRSICENYNMERRRGPGVYKTVSWLSTACKSAGKGTSNSTSFPLVGCVKRN